MSDYESFLLEENESLSKRGIHTLIPDDFLYFLTMFFDRNKYLQDLSFTNNIDKYLYCYIMLF